MPELFKDYSLDSFYDEMFAAPGQPRAHYQRLFDRFAQMDNMAELLDRQQHADQTFLSRGVTFTVYSDERGTEKIFPFDLIPRIVPAHEWARLEAGLAQRMTALNLFLADIYGPQRILRENIVPRQMVESSKNFRPEMVGFAVPRGLYVHINGTDLVRDEQGDYRVLEDNLRTPSGVSYVLENRTVMKRVFPSLFSAYRVRAIE
ncbi:MAG TPA: circularly permuted type 2 ATP-grasp protein, partial [Opitutaceae bacterium]|nr:circularly permuted type 2 ATP-grasp protein [Opitutaceae bacterium]